MKHTKGKWEVNTPEKTDTHYTIDSVYEDQICNVVSNGQPLEEVKANAKLIAAAPEMLERLQYVVSWLEDAKVHADIVRHCKTTIKKATE